MRVSQVLGPFKWLWEALRERLLDLRGLGLLPALPGWSVLGWGMNSTGQLADGTTVDHYTPTWAQLVGQVNAIAASGFGAVYALMPDRTVRAWGVNGYGQLGDGTTTPRTAPATVAGLSDVVAIAAGLRHVLALRRDGTVWAWGGNYWGELGYGQPAPGTFEARPAQVPGVSDIVAIAAGWLHSLALCKDGTVFAWGGNANGQVGNGSTQNQLSPVRIPRPAKVHRIAAGAYHSVALLGNGTVWTWGYNMWGQLGDGSTVDRLDPVHVGGGLGGVTAVAGGAGHTLALAAGVVWGWGLNAYGQIGGPGWIYSTPVAVPGLTGVTEIACAGHSLALVGSALYAWGYNGAGQIGSGTHSPQSPLVHVPLPAVPVHVVAGSFESYALVREEDPV